jgi:hypothetical protein
VSAAPPLFPLRPPPPPAPLGVGLRGVARGASLFGMARPIEPTPTLQGEDAERLLRELANVCPPEEAQRRIELARRERAEMMRPKNEPTGEPKRG